MIKDDNNFDNPERQSFILYTAQNGQVQIEIYLYDETYGLPSRKWLNYLVLPSLQLANI